MSADASRDHGISLNSVYKVLGLRFYGLPRFGTPQTFWYCSRSLLDLPVCSLFRFGFFHTARSRNKGPADILNIRSPQSRGLFCVFCLVKYSTVEPIRFLEFESVFLRFRPVLVFKYDIKASYAHICMSMRISGSETYHH